MYLFRICNISFCYTKHTQLFLKYLLEDDHVHADTGLIRYTVVQYYIHYEISISHIG